LSKADRLAAVLDSFLDVSAEAEAAAVVSADGLPMASALPVHVEEDRLAAMSAALLTLGERAAEGLGRGELGQVFVEGQDGYVVLMAAGPHAVLVVITSKRAKIGLALFEMRRAAEQISEVMAETAEPPAPMLESAPPTPAEAVISDAMGEAPPPPFESPEDRVRENSEAPVATWQ
jgi:predicted regulator of Ras-like GTPase activity (Roadblock/LC7/MglB family)